MKYYFLVLFLIPTFLLKAQDNQADTTAQKRYSLIGLPLVYFTPETNWAFGGLGVFSFRFKSESMESLPSQLNLGVAYTLNKQVLIYLPYQLYFKDELYKVYGELGYYRYNYFFYGIGNQTKAEDEEIYDVNFPRIRLNALYLLRENTYVGLRYTMDNFTDLKTAEGGILDSQDITGKQGGLVSGFGIVGNYDSRDNLFYASKGMFLETVLYWNPKSLGSDFNFNKLTIDASKFWTTSWKHIIAVNAYGEFTGGDAPFYQLALLGGNKRMRGYLEGRFRDNHYMTVQVEYRLPLFWRLGAVVFGTYGGVANKLSNFSLADFEYSYGGGLRVLLDKKEHVNLRIDYGLSKSGGGNLYFTVGEAF